MLDVKLPPPELITVDTTVREVYKALKKNGFEHIRGTWSTAEGGCVLMQTAWNLDVRATGWAGHEDAIASIGEPPNGTKAYNEWQDKYYKEVDRLNSFALERQLDKWTVPDDSPWSDDETRGSGLGAVIIHWNDKSVYDEKMQEVRWALPTYEDVAKMAYDLLSPHFDEPVQLVKYEYPSKPAKKSN